MARHTKIVLGTVKDGDTEASSENTLAKKVYDTIANATTIHGVSISKYGKLSVALLVWDD